MILSNQLLKWTLKRKLYLEMMAKYLSDKMWPKNKQTYISFFGFRIWIKSVGGLNIRIQCPEREQDFVGLQNSKHICRYSKEQGKGVIQQLRGQNFAQLWPPTPLTIGDIFTYPLLSWPRVDFQLTAYLLRVNSVVVFQGAGLGRLITIKSELNGAI